MRVILAEAMGMCFGVRDALALARQVENPVEVTVFGQLVHNPLVHRELSTRGFSLLDEATRGPATVATSTVLITAHGVSDRERAGLLAAGKRVVDTTCPLVRKAHTQALALARAGFFVVVAGKRGHVEVRGLTGDLDRFEVVETCTEVRRWDTDKIAVIAQTTAMEREVHGIVAQAKALNPHARVRLVNTICRPTRDRQAALERLVEQVDVMVVVGGSESNNARQLVARSQSAGIRTLQVEGSNEGELHEEMFEPWEVVGLTAATSTLAETVEAVHKRLETFHSSREHSESTDVQRIEVGHA